MSNNNPGSKKSKVFPLFITFAIIFILAFTLGIIVGKGLGGSDAPVVEKTYEIGVPEEGSDVEIVEEEVPQDSDVEDKISKLEPEDIVTEEDGVPKEEQEKLEDERIRAEDQVSGTEHIELRKDTPKPTITEAPVASSKEQVLKDIKEQSLKKSPAPKVESASTTASLPKIDPNGQYTVQLAALQNREQANALMNSIKSKGYPAFVKQFVTPDKKTWYRVRVGTFSTKEQAAKYGEELKKQQPQVKSVFVTTNN